MLDALGIEKAHIVGAKYGGTVAISCDGCEKGLSANITVLSREPEFTPPVIYSLESRQTLVYLVEARASHDRPLRLQPGQIVDVDLPALAK